MYEGGNEGVAVVINGCHLNYRTRRVQRGLWVGLRETRRKPNGWRFGSACIADDQTPRSRIRESHCDPEFAHYVRSKKPEASWTWHVCILQYPTAATLVRRLKHEAHLVVHCCSAAKHDDCGCVVLEAFTSPRIHRAATGICDHNQHQLSDLLHLMSQANRQPY